jgi:hypothetical protein
LAGVVGTRWWRSGSAVGRGRLGVGRGRGVFLDGHAEFVELAIVLDVFRRDALGNRLGAFELGAGIEEAALLAAMQFEIALGAGAVGIETGREDRAAVGTAGAGDRADHAGSAGAELIHAAGTAGRRFALAWFILFVAFFRVAIAAVSILSIHKRLQQNANSVPQGWAVKLQR